jgi:hypothetical protein
LRELSKTIEIQRLGQAKILNNLLSTRLVEFGSNTRRIIHGHAILRGLEDPKIHTPQKLALQRQTLKDHTSQPLLSKPGLMPA